MSYTYQISAYRYGGEHTIGTIPRKVALWWMQNHSDDFEHYFMQDDKTHDSEDNWGHIPEEYRLENFYENADILHHDCCEFSDEGWIKVNLIDEIKKTVVVVQVDKDWNEHPPIERRILPKEIANIKFEDIDQSEDNAVNFASWEELLEENNPDIFHKIYPKDNNTLPELCAVYGQRFFKGGWVFSRFTTNHKFDASKLIFTTKQFEDSQLLVGFKYEDEEMILYSSDGDHKWDRAWIDDYLLDWQKKEKYFKISTYSESVENDKMEASINDDWLSEYMAFVVDPVIFKKDNLIRLGYGPETIKEILNE